MDSPEYTASTEGAVVIQHSVSTESAFESTTAERSHTTAATRTVSRPRSFTDAVRLQESFTASVERKALAWLARRLPPWMNSDHLTGLGLLAMLGAGAS